MTVTLQLVIELVLQTLFNLIKTLKLLEILERGVLIFNSYSWNFSKGENSILLNFM